MTERDRLKLAESIDNIEMCHAQGKPAINADDPECKVIRTVWPNGVIDRLTVATDQVTRTWPDGKQESFEHNSPEDILPVVPGQPRIYELDSIDNLYVFRTEWPNGVVDDHWLFTHEVVRTWPDGKRERFRRNSPEHIKPVLPGDEDPT